MENRKARRIIRKCKLSDREVSILRFISQGLTDDQIADILYLKSITISKINQRIRRKLEKFINKKTGELNRVDMAVFAVKHKIA